MTGGEVLVLGKIGRNFGAGCPVAMRTSLIAMNAMSTQVS